MAGNYPDPPAPRVAYDRDGSVGLMVTENGFAYELSNAQLQILNNESSDSMNDNSSGNFRYWTIIFPSQRDLVGYFSMRSGSGNTNTFDVSSNSTNGIDGTWVSVANPWANAGSVNPNYRNGINTIARNNVKAVRFCINRNSSLTATMHAIHLYGEYSGGQNTDRLRLWHPTLDEPLDDNNSTDAAWLEWGDVVRGTMADRSFRYKNNSASLTANSITVTADTLTDTAPSVPPQFTFSNGGAFAASLNIGTLAPGEISPVLSIRRTTPANATLSVWSGRINASPASWS